MERDGICDIQCLILTMSTDTCGLDDDAAKLRVAAEVAHANSDLAHEAMVLQHLNLKG